MAFKIVWMDRFLAVVAFALGVVSIFIRDVDKCPIYFMLAYVLWRLK